MTKLYKKDARGKTRVWTIEGNDWGLEITSGLLHGEKTKTQIDVPYGKANRTWDEQVALVMNRKIERKKDTGYVELIEDVNSSGKNQMGFDRQMKAKLVNDGDIPEVDYTDFAFVQRKYNGHRCTITKNAGRTVAYSSGGKPITSVQHVLDSIIINEGQRLDGELYIHGLSLQKISSKVRTENVTDKDLKFVCFDQITDEIFYNRWQCIPKQDSIYIVMAETIQVKNWKEVKGLFHQFRAEKYEGAMLRHGRLPYQCGIRSKSICKIKKLDGVGYYDEEFEVIRIIESVEGWARLVCKTRNGKKFKVSCHGSHYYKTKVLENKKDYIGKFVKVEFPERTDDGKPSQPVAIVWRDKDE